MKKAKDEPAVAPAEETHHPDCPATDGFPCRCKETEAEAAAAEAEPDIDGAVVPVAEWKPINLATVPALAAANMEVLAAIAGAMLEITAVQKRSRNDFAKYNYASVDAFLAVLRPVMAKHGLVALLDPVECQTTGKHLVFQWSLTVAHVSGGAVTVRVDSAAPLDMGPQAYGGARSYALKFGLRDMFLVAAEEPGEDVDSRKAGRLEERQPPRRPQQQQPAPAVRNARDGGPIPGYVPSTAAPEPGPDFDTPLGKLKKRMRDAGVAASRVCAYFAVNELADLSPQQITDANKVLDEHAKKPAREPGAEG